MRNFLEKKKFRRKDQQAEKDQTERVTGLGRRTGEEIAKWNQVTARRFQTGGRHQISLTSLRGPTTEDSLPEINHARKKKYTNIFKIIPSVDWTIQNISQIF